MESVSVSERGPYQTPYERLISQPEEVVGVVARYLEEHRATEVRTGFINPIVCQKLLGPDFSVRQGIGYSFMGNVWIFLRDNGYVLLRREPPVPPYTRVFVSLPNPRS